MEDMGINTYNGVFALFDEWSFFEVWACKDVENPMVESILRDFALIIELIQALTRGLHHLDRALPLVTFVVNPSRRIFGWHESINQIGI